MKMTDKLRKRLYRFLRIHEWDTVGYDINRLLTFEGNAAKNLIWYNGDSYELGQFFSQIAGESLNMSFWGASQSHGLEIRKMHCGLPKLIVNTLSDIVVSDMNDFNFTNAAERDLWLKIAEENKFDDLVSKATKGTLKVGDGAFKISFAEDVSKLPIIEYYSGEDVDFTYNRGRIIEVKFYDRYLKDGIRYTLEEVYGYGYIRYHLFMDETLIDLHTIPETNGLSDVDFDSKIILAVPYMIYESDIYKGRGQSVYEGKSDAFDALDEIVSQWQDAIRCGRVKTYIPESLIPRDPNGGFMLKPNAFDNRFIKIGTDMAENSRNEIKTEQPNIQVEAYQESYATYLNLALQGVMSPSTIGVDTKRLDNAESQREKEKTTLYTRKAIISALSKTLKKLVQVSFDAYNLQYKKELEDVDFEISFGEYANPSFEAVVQTMSNPNTPMSIEAKVEEIWGDSKSSEWKEKEVERIKEERGILEADELSFAENFINNKTEMRHLKPEVDDKEMQKGINNT